MSFNIKLLFSSILLLSLFHLQVIGQSGANSPYSIIGLGEQVPQGSLRNIGMGGIGVAAGSALGSNIINPSLLIYNKLTVFEAAYMGEYKSLEGPNSSQEDIGANLQYLNFAFPVNPRWTMGVGMRPLTSVSYTISELEKVPETPSFVEYEYTGDGGLTRVYFSNAVNVWKTLSLGLELSYNFGFINNESKSQLIDGTQDYIVGLFERTNYSKIASKFGISYTHRFNEKTNLNLGATYETETDYNATYFQSIQRRSLNDTRISTDTLSLNQDRNITYPSSYQLGLSYEKVGKYTIGIDYEAQQWSSFKDLEGNSTLEDGYRVSLGGEWTPDYTSVSSYFKRITLRAGARYTKLPTVVNGTQLEDYGINFGLSLPVSRSFSSINLAFAYGMVDVEAEGLIKEQYMRVYLGLTINDRWFVKRRVN